MSIMLHVLKGFISKKAVLAFPYLWLIIFSTAYIYINLLLGWKWLYFHPLILITFFIMVSFFLPYIVLYNKKEFRVTSRLSHDDNLDLVEIYTELPDIFQRKLQMYTIRYRYSSMINTNYYLHEMVSWNKIFAEHYKYFVIKIRHPKFFILRYLPEAPIIALTLVFMTTFSSVFAVVENDANNVKVTQSLYIDSLASHSEITYPTLSTSSKKILNHITATPALDIYLFFFLLIFSLFLKLLTILFILDKIIIDYKMMKPFISSIILEQQINYIIEEEEKLHTSFIKFFLGKLT